MPAVTYANRIDNPGFNKTEAERTFSFKEASAWPLPNTTYKALHLNAAKELAGTVDSDTHTFSYEGLTGESIQFETLPFEQEMEITGHPVFNCTVGIEKDDKGRTPKDMDLFVTLRHIDGDAKKVFYTGETKRKTEISTVRNGLTFLSGTSGDPVPLTKGWLRVSLRKLSSDSKSFLPRRNYLSTDVESVKVVERYNVVVELWPTNITVSKGGKLILEVGPKDQQGCGIFTHNHPEDRSEDRFGGTNLIDVGNSSSTLVLPFV